MAVLVLNADRIVGSQNDASETVGASSQGSQVRGAGRDESLQASRERDRADLSKAAGSVVVLDRGSKVEIAGAEVLAISDVGGGLGLGALEWGDEELSSLHLIRAAGYLERLVLLTEAEEASSSKFVTLAPSRTVELNFVCSVEGREVLFTELEGGLADSKELGCARLQADGLAAVEDLLALADGGQLHDLGQAESAEELSGLDFETFQRDTAGTLRIKVAQNFGAVLTLAPGARYEVSDASGDAGVRHWGSVKGERERVEILPATLDGEVSLCRSPSAGIAGSVPLSCGVSGAEVQLRLLSFRESDGLPMWTEVASLPVSSDGEYFALGIPPGQYRIRCKAPCEEQAALDFYYGDEVVAPGEICQAEPLRKPPQSTELVLFPSIVADGARLRIDDALALREIRAEDWSPLSVSITAGAQVPAEYSLNEVALLQSSGLTLRGLYPNGDYRVMPLPGGGGLASRAYRLLDRQHELLLDSGFGPRMAEICYERQEWLRCAVSVPYAPGDSGASGDLIVWTSQGVQVEPLAWNGARSQFEASAELPDATGLILVAIDEPSGLRLGARLPLRTGRLVVECEPLVRVDLHDAVSESEASSCGIVDLDASELLGRPVYVAQIEDDQIGLHAFVVSGTRSAIFKNGELLATIDN